MATLKDLIDLGIAARFDPGCDAKPAQSMVSDGHEFSVSYHVVNRKCYDFLPTPTAMYKIDGKRVARKVFMGMASDRK